GGWNPRDAPSEVAGNESPDCMNVTLDNRGGVVKRLGLFLLGTGGGLGSPPVNSFYWPGEQKAVIQDGGAVKGNDDFVSYTTIHTFSSSDLMGFADFNDKLIMVHPIDGVYSYSSGSGFAGPFGSPVKGNSVAVWQNKLWVTGDSAHKARVWWS